MINIATNKYLGLTSGEVNANTGNGGGYQNWIVIDDGNGYFSLQDQITLKVLENDSIGDVYTNFATLADSQKWYSSGTNIINKATGKYLESNVNGDVFTSTSSGTDSQKWNKQYLA